MGLDVALVVFPGEVLTGPELARATQSLAAGRDLVLVRQAGVPRTACAALAVYEVAPGAQLNIPEAELKAAQAQAEASGSLAEVVQVAFKLMRKSLHDLPRVTARDESDDHPLRDVACAISQARGTALVAGVFDHSSLGAVTRCAAGLVVEHRMPAGDTWESVPDAALAAFVGDARARVQPTFATALEGALAWVVAERGQGLAAPRPMSEAELRDLDAEPLLF